MHDTRYCVFIISSFVINVTEAEASKEEIIKLHPTTPTTSITKQRVLVLPKNKNAGFINLPEPESDEGDVTLKKI